MRAAADRDAVDGAPPTRNVDCFDAQGTVARGTRALVIREGRNPHYLRDAVRLRCR